MDKPCPMLLLRKSMSIVILVTIFAWTGIWSLSHISHMQKMQQLRQRLSPLSIFASWISEAYHAVSPWKFELANWSYWSIYFPFSMNNFANAMTNWAIRLCSFLWCTCYFQLPFRNTGVPILPIISSCGCSPERPQAMVIIYCGRVFQVHQRASIHAIRMQFHDFIRHSHSRHIDYWLFNISLLEVIFD